jgi:hypothetical protein
MTAPLSRAAVKHTTATMATAQAMYADGQGWTPTQIARYLLAHGTPVSVTTIRRWVDPEWAERRRAQQRKPSSKQPSDERAALRKILHLRTEHGVSYSALSVILREYHGVELDENRIRHWMTRHGAERNPNKARAAARAMDRSSLRTGHRAGVVTTPASDSTASARPAGGPVE